MIAQLTKPRLMKSLLLVISINTLVACSSNSLPTPVKSLSTREANSQYFYCESCPRPTELTLQTYQPLEPDAPDTSVTPLIKPHSVLPNPIPSHAVQRRIHHQPRGRFKNQRAHKRYKRKPAHSTKQCIQWR